MTGTLISIAVVTLMFGVEMYAVKEGFLTRVSAVDSLVRTKLIILGAGIGYDVIIHISKAMTDVSIGVQVL
jgi:hypothetical protein